MAVPMNASPEKPTEKSPEKSPEKSNDEPQNLLALFERQVAKRGAETSALSKVNGKWEELSWKQLGEDSRAMADGLCGLGVTPGDSVAILAATSVDFVRADLAALGAGAVVVPIYQSNKPHECGYILADSKARYVFVDTEAQAAKIREVRGELAELRGMIRLDRGRPATDFEIPIEKLIEDGRSYRRAHEDEHARRLAAVRDDDMCCIIYTAGTTGQPKGVELTHRNWIYEANAVAQLGILRPDDVLLFFLPLAHVFAKVVETVWFSEGFRMAFAESVDKLVQNAGEVRPTVLPAVPRVFEKAYDTVVQSGLAAPGLRGALFKLAFRSFERYADALAHGNSHIGLRDRLGLALGRRLVFPKLHEALSQRFGGRLRLFVSGSAPLSPKVARFFEEIGMVILEGYGLSETSAGSSINLPGRVKIGTVGPPLPGTEIKIAPDGEILIHGDGVMKGYHGKPEATAEVLKDGWFATGDIGELDADGYLKITDRKKDIIVTAGGKKIPPQNLENELQTSPLLGHALVYGDGRKFISALLTLKPANAVKLAEERGSPARSLEELSRAPVIVDAVQHTIDALNEGLPRYSTIKRFSILPIEFTVEGGELTPKLSVRRKLLSQRYQSLLDSFYTDGSSRSDHAQAVAQ
jgi:long-chain acyl-CoA synthetase